MVADALGSIICLAIAMLNVEESLPEVLDCSYNWGKNKTFHKDVSQSCSPYVQAGFLLLLVIAVFSTDRIIAMSFPSSGKQSFYRNPIKVKNLTYQIHCF